MTDSATEPETPLMKRLIDQKSQAGGMAFYGIAAPLTACGLFGRSVFNLWAVLTTQAVAIPWIIGLQHPRSGGTSFRGGITIVTLSTFGAGAWFVTGFVMPDIYAGVAVNLRSPMRTGCPLLNKVGLAAVLAASVRSRNTILWSPVVLTLAGIGATHFLRSEGDRSGSERCSNGRVVAVCSCAVSHVVG